MRFSFTAGREWRPLETRLHPMRPEAGQLLAHQHTVWKVIRTDDLPLTDEDRDVWLSSGTPELATWPKRPYRVTVEWVGGAKPAWLTEKQRTGSLDVHAGAWKSWCVYRNGRWPQCSCCGEPMPCRTELADEQVLAGLARITKLEAIPAGACWACAEPITARQEAVTYPGDNLDLPGGQPPHFHTRSKCAPSARAYEERWIAADPRRERLLTWPRCNGILIVHADGSSECVAGRDALGQQRATQPDCQGHITHDHGIQRACYVGERYLDTGVARGCPRGCDPETHRGTATTPRPKRRQPSTGGLFQ